MYYFTTSPASSKLCHKDDVIQWDSVLQIRIAGWGGVLNICAVVVL